MEDNSPLSIVDSSKSLDQWVFDTITPIVIMIDKIMEKILSCFEDVDRYVY